MMLRDSGSERRAAPKGAGPELRRARTTQGPNYAGPELRRTQSTRAQTTQTQKARTQDTTAVRAGSHSRKNESTIFTITTKRLWIGQYFLVLIRSVRKFALR